MPPATVAPDGCLQPALDRLYGAVGALLDERKECVGGSILCGPSPYQQLCDEVPSMPGDEYVRGYRKSTAPVWCDALDLRDEIDTAVRAWHPGGGSTPTRLRGLAALAAGGHKTLPPLSRYPATSRRGSARSMRCCRMSALRTCWESDAACLRD